MSPSSLRQPALHRFRRHFARDLTQHLPVGGRRRRAPHGCGSGSCSSSSENPAVGRAFLGGWHADRGLASQRSFRPKNRSDEDGADFHGQTRKNDTHRSTTDPDSRLYRKAMGREAKLSHMGARHHGEPPWAGGGGFAEQGDRHGRAARVRSDARCPTQAGSSSSVFCAALLSVSSPCLRIRQDV